MISTDMCHPRNHYGKVILLWSDPLDLV